MSMIGKILAHYEITGHLGFPQILPDGKSLLFTTEKSAKDTIMVQSLKSGETKELFPGNAAHYLPTGHIIYALGNNLFA